MIEQEGSRIYLSSLAASHSHTIIHVYRDIDHVINELEKGGDSRRPDYQSPIADVFTRRLPLYRQCRNFVFPVVDQDWEKIKIEFNCFVKRIREPCTPLG